MFALFLVFVVLVFFCLLDSANKAELRKRVKAAYEGYRPENPHGVARFANSKDLKKAGLFKDGGIRIGFSPDGRRKLFFNGAGHLLLVAGARAGKALTILVGVILSLPRRYGLLVFDPKAELMCICGHYLKRRGEVWIINPFGIHLDRLKGLKQARFNPMASLDTESRPFHADCDKLADAICWEEGHGGASHWIISARLLISGVIAALAKYGAPEDRHLAAVRNTITGSTGNSLFDFCRECMNLPDPYIRQKLARFAAPGAEDNKELNGIVSTADTQTGFIGNQAIAECLKGSDVRFRDLKRKKGMTIAVCLPLDKLDVSHKFFRILAASAISETLVEGLRGKGSPVLAIFDEVAQIGPLKVLADAWAMGAGAAGLQMLAVYQSVGQIMDQFKTVWQTVVANSSTTIWFGVRDPQTAEFVSKQCGITEIVTQSRSVSIDPRTGEPLVNDGASQAARPLLHPDEVQFGLGDDEMLMFCDRVPGVIRAKRKPYFRCPDLKGKYRDNPYYQKLHGSFLRWLGW